MVKKIKLKLSNVLNAEFVIKIPAAQKTTFLKDLKRAELGVGVEIEYDSITTSSTIYPNHFKDAGLIFTKKTEDAYLVKINGAFDKDLDNSFDADLITALANDAKLEIRAIHVYDSDMNYYYINGDEDFKLVIGSVNLKK